jgi:acetoin utilization protein AcuB
MHVRDWMTQHPVTVVPTAPVEEAYRLLVEYEIRHLLVVVDGRLIGVVSDRDLAESIVLATHGEPANRTVGDVMTRQVRTIGQDEPIAKAALLMHDAKIGALPVLGQEDNLVGILTTNDLLEVLVAQLSSRSVG